MPLIEQNVLVAEFRRGPGAPTSQPASWWLSTTELMRNRF